MSKQKRKIIFYIKDPNGGPSRFLENIVNILKTTNNFDFKIITHIQVKGFFLNTKKIGFSLDKQSNFSLNKIFLSLINLCLFYKEIIEYKPNIIFSLDIYANLTTSLIKYLIPQIKIIHSSRVNLQKHLFEERNKFFGLFLKKIIIFLYKKSDKHLVSSKGLKNQLIENFEIEPKNIIVIPNPVNSYLINKLSHKPIQNKQLLRSFKNKKVIKIFTMGRFDEQKNLFLVLKVIKALFEKRQNITLFIIGDGRLKKDYIKEVKKLKISKSVFFLGWQKNPYKFLRLADLFLHFTNYEGFPNSLLEAGSLGIFSVASDVDFGPREILTHKSGILIKNNYSPKHIADLVNNVLDKKIDIFSRNKIIKEMRRFDINSLKKRYLALLN
jgi:glycosyltransferase involved in cell wall biosynthesis